ncbi:hypothetical protein HPP92_015500 [Vanilla planifolia]|uniref:Pentatricopeptide repeat-containing protein n=1 Tax=Vanilla planifolia TaxID=51239 RepID=A0A835QSA1_VANPL|nr:hypothetical protein HPP92_015500 [Vanilla planifolia]
MMALTSIPVGIPVGANPSSGNGRHLLPANYPILSLLDDVSTLDSIRLKQIHARMLRLGLFFQPYASSRLITACSLSPSPNLHYALQVFNQIPQPSLYMWNILIRSHVANSRPDLSLQLFSRLLTDSPHFPDNFTYPFAFKAAAELEMLREGSALHGQVVKGPFNSDVFILNSLVHFYATCGDVDLALRVFDFIPQRDVVSWNCMIAALARADRCDDALELFRMMQNGNISPDDITMVAVLSACGKKGDLELGRWLHSFIKRSGISECLILNNAILDMYTKCESSADARLLFDGMTEKDSISWTTMLFVYCKSRDFDAARHFFDTMPVRDIAAWNALISGYEQNGRPKDALAAFAELQNSSDAEPDQVTLVATLSACSQLCAIESGKWIHSFIEKRNLKLNHRLTASLIDMYSKCGDVGNALQVFRTVKQGDVFVWSSMIAGLAMHGRGKEALEFFKQMQKANVKPNHVTFTNVLCACSHAGLVEVGRMYFTQMLTVYGLSLNLSIMGAWWTSLAVPVVCKRRRS